MCFSTVVGLHIHGRRCARYSEKIPFRGDHGAHFSEYLWPTCQLLRCEVQPRAGARNRCSLGLIDWCESNAGENAKWGGTRLQLGTRPASRNTEQHAQHCIPSPIVFTSPLRLHHTLRQPLHRTMAHRYTTWSNREAPVKALDAWIQDVYTPPLAGADFQVPCICPDGTLGLCPLGEAALVVRDLHLISAGAQGSRRPRRGGRSRKQEGARWISGTPAVFKARVATNPTPTTTDEHKGSDAPAGDDEYAWTCFVRACDSTSGTKHPGYKQWLGVDDASKVRPYGDIFLGEDNHTALMAVGLATHDNHAAIFQQSARCYLNVGKNRGDMCHSFVPNAYMSFFKDTLFAFASARSAETRDALALALVALRLSMAAYFDVFPASKAVWEPLLQDTAAFDVLQRAAAFCFSSKPMDDEVRLRILEITLKRMRKRLSGPIDLLTHDLAGPIAVLFAVPCLRSIDTPFKVATMLAEFNAKSVDLLVCMTMLSGGDDVRERNVAILSKLAELGGVPAVDARLLDWANDPANLHVEAPLEEWGAIPPATSSFWTLRGGIRVNPTSEVLPQVKVEAGIEDNCVNFVSTAPTGWNAVVIRDVGVYTITPELVGEARAGRGNTLHAAQAANFRVTSCRATEPLVFPPDRKGASSAGREYTDEAGAASQGRRGGRGRRTTNRGGFDSWRPRDNYRDFDRYDHDASRDYIPRYGSERWRGGRTDSRRRSRSGHDSRRSTRFGYRPLHKFLSLDEPFDVIITSFSADRLKVEIWRNKTAPVVGKRRPFYTFVTPANDCVVLAWKWMNLQVVHTALPPAARHAVAEGKTEDTPASTSWADIAAADDKAAMAELEGATPSVQQLMADLQRLKRDEARLQAQTAERASTSADQDSAMTVEAQPSA